MDERDGGERHRQQPRFFRPPYGATGASVNRLGRSLGLVPVLWSSTAATGSSRDEAIVRRVLANVKPGAIVLLHDGGGDRQETLRALPAILRALKRRHPQVFTLSRMFERSAPELVLDGSFEGGELRP